MAARSPSRSRSRSQSPVRRASPRKTVAAETGKGTSRSKTRSTSKSGKRRGKMEAAEMPRDESNDAPIMTIVKKEMVRTVSSPVKAASTAESKSKGKSNGQGGDDSWSEAGHILFCGGAGMIVPMMFLLTDKGHLHIAQLMDFLLALCGLRTFKPRGIIVLSLVIYTFLTYVVLLIGVLLATVIRHGVAPDSTHPRLQHAQLGGLAHRISAAQSNCVEALTLWTVCAGLAFLAKVPEDLIMKTTVLFVDVRLLYIVSYAMGWGTCRVICYMSSFGLLFGLLVNAVLPYF